MSRSSSLAPHSFRIRSGRFAETSSLKSRFIDYVREQSISQIEAYDLCISNFEKIIKYPLYNIFLFLLIYKGKFYILYKKGDSRKERILSIFARNIKSLYQNKKIHSNAFIPIYVSDTHFYENNDLPFFVEARPKNDKGILYPDQNFYFINMGNQQNINYDQFKTTLHQEGCASRVKRPVLFFRGANTGADKHNMRMKLKEISANDPKYEIHIKEQFMSMPTFCDFKYLLNLPGHQPWSYRFSKILAMDSLVFHINVLQSYDGGKSYNQKWIQFFDEFFVNGEDYVELDYHWMEHKTSNNDVIKIYQQLNELYIFYENHPELYKKMVQNAHRKTDLITMDVCDYVIQFLLEHFIEKFNKTNRTEDIERFLERAIASTPKDQISIFPLHSKPKSKSESKSKAKSNSKAKSESKAKTDSKSKMKSRMNIKE